ncbi:MAG TPA: UbiX family flavin prenyltransferase [Candidatus Acidoferrum sp.]|nr:UbiX family flavin prenyltransferase [Candidatus Acidoferrum sp.]
MLDSQDDLSMLFVVAVTGASGSIYARRLLEELKRSGHETLLLISDEAKNVMKQENEDLHRFEELATRTFSEHELDSPASSGSVKTGGMIVIPCSMKTVSSIAHGLSGNAITRAADVTLKERRTLILVPRETPLSTIQLRNLLRVAEAGAIVLPAMPAFYSKPKSIDDMVNFIVGRVLDLLSVPHNLFRRWGEID